eukprot:gene8393-17307_t
MMFPSSQGSVLRSENLSHSLRSEKTSMGIQSSSQTLRFYPSFFPEMQCLYKLKGHDGCVNRLTWNFDGKFLASCSDDLTVCIWRLGDTEPYTCFNAGHTDNIFGIRFLPNTNDQFLVTGAMDGAVALHELDASKRTHVKSQVYPCHRGQVKYVETEPQSPHVFFSASDDSHVRQYDTRLPYCGCTSYENGAVGLGALFPSMNSLIREPMAGGIRSVRVCPVDVNLLLIACGDPFVRLYDRRMLFLTGPSGDASTPMQTYCPEHLEKASYAHATYAEFSACGRRIVATYHADHCYTFDRDCPRQPFAAQFPLQVEKNNKAGSAVTTTTSNSELSDVLLSPSQIKLISLIQEALNVATDLFMATLSCLGLRCVSEALFLCNSKALAGLKITSDLTVRCLQLRGILLFKRGYMGDTEAALRYFSLISPFLNPVQSTSVTPPLSMSASTSASASAPPPSDHQSESESEQLLINYSQRFIGMSNVSTDIKEAVFLGTNSE